VARKAEEAPPCSTRYVSDERPEPSGVLYRTVVVAVATVSMVEVFVHQVVNVIAVWHRFVSASGAVLVACFVRTTCVIGRAVHRIRFPNRQAVLIHVVRVGMMEMAAVQVVGMAVVAHGYMTAALPVDMGVTLVRVAGHR
jgi:hypothetical protein